MPNPLLSQITSTDGTTYDLKDAEARADIATLKRAKGWIGITTTPLSDGDSTNPIEIDGDSVTAVAGNITAYQQDEFIFNGSIWQAFGVQLDDLGALAYKDGASGNFTPAGSIAPTTDAIQPIDSVGSMPTFTVTGETLVIGAGVVPTLGTAKTFMTGATFSGTQGVITVS